MDFPNTNNIGALGGKDFILGFQLAGVKKTYDLKNISAEEVLDKESLDILILDGKDVSGFSPRLKEKVEASVRPTVVIVSESSEAEDTMRKMIKKAIGVDLWDKK